MSSPNKSIAVGADDAAFDLKAKLIDYLKSKGIQVEDYGVKTPDPNFIYPDVALEVAQAVAAGKHDRAILMCGTGIGMAITANKVPDIRAAVCHDVYSAERSRKSNDCQVLALGGQVIGEELAKTLVDIKVHRSYVGNYFTSLEMMGITFTVMRVDDELKRLIDLEAESTGLSQLGR